MPVPSLDSARCLVALLTLLATPARATLELGGGTRGWDRDSWYVQVDGVMGGKSSGNVAFLSNTMVFSGTINLDGGGFSSVRKRLGGDIDLSGFAGLLLEVESEVFRTVKAPLGLHIQLGDSVSRYDFAAAVAIPFSSDPERQVCKIFIPMDGFDRGSRMGWTCSSCSLDIRKVNELDVYVLFQEGAFEVRLKSIAAVAQKPDELLPTTPSIILNPPKIRDLIKATINRGAYVYDKGYSELCIAIYAQTARQIVMAQAAPQALRSLACAGLRESSPSSVSKANKAWILRRAFDALLADIDGEARKSDSRYPAAARGSWLPEPGKGSEECDELAESMTVSAEARPMASVTTSSKEASISGEELSNFLGPFEGMGISGYNDLGNSYVKGPADCATKCLQNPRCKSFDFGARGKVAGECWLSTASRASAASAYSRWDLYDYYELNDGSAVDADASAVTGSFNSGNDIGGASDNAVTSSDKGDTSDSSTLETSTDMIPSTLLIVILVGVLIGGIACGVAIVLLCSRAKASPHGMSNGMPGNSATMDVPTIVVGQPVQKA